SSSSPSGMARRREARVVPPTLWLMLAQPPKMWSSLGQQMSSAKQAMFRQKRIDTLVGNVEAIYDICFNARSDMKLGTLLEERGFMSLSQLLKAARGRQYTHACMRALFLSFHNEDLAQVNGFRLMMKNRHLRLDISDDASRYPVNSEHSTYIKRAIRQRIRAS